MASEREGDAVNGMGIADSIVLDSKSLDEHRGIPTALFFVRHVIRFCVKMS